MGPGFESLRVYKEKGGFCLLILLVYSTQARYAECARFVGIQAKDDAEAVKKLMEKIEDLKKQVGVKSSIQAYGIDEKDFLDRLDDMVEQAFDDQCTGANPRYPLMSEIKEMYLRAYYGK